MSEFLSPTGEEQKLYLVKQTCSGKRHTIALPTQKEYDDRVGQEIYNLAIGRSHPIGLLGLSQKTEHSFIVVGYRTVEGVEDALAKNSLPFGIGEKREKEIYECVERYTRGYQTAQFFTSFMRFVAKIWTAH